MVSCGLLRRVALVRTDVSEEPGASFIRVTKIGELRTTQAATSNRRMLRRNTTRCNNPQDTKNYIVKYLTKRKKNISIIFLKLLALKNVDLWPI
jgi:hypothetical protein